MTNAATHTVHNTTAVASIDMIGPALGVCVGIRQTTVVRKTTDGRFAVLTSKMTLIKIFKDEIHARRYNFAINGQQLGG